MIILRHDEGVQLFISVENKILVESVNIKQGILDLISTYCSFDIAYPRQLYPVLVFIQHIILKIVDKQRVPNNVPILCTSLDTAI